MRRIDKQFLQHKVMDELSLRPPIPGGISAWSSLWSGQMRYS
jgi:hypothetical protein